MIVLRLPSPAENIVEATLIRWRAATGDALAAGDPLAEIVTEKAAFDYEVPEAGVLTHTFAPAGSVLPVGYVLALLDGDDARAGQARAENDALLASHAETLSGGGALPSASRSSESTASVASAAPAGRARATPAARRLAKELGVDLAALGARHPGELLKENHVRAAAPGSGKA